MDILLGTGLGAIRFGWSFERLVDELGAPDKTWTQEFLEGEVELKVRYNHLWATLELEENRVVGIECQSPNLVLLGRRLIGGSRATVLAFVAQQLGQVPEFEDYGNLEVYEFVESRLYLHFDYDRLVGVDFGVHWSTGDEPLWPT